ncbi:nitrite reductase small subunit NirD [Guyparkeria hydrothermalis]|uniref:nitrite reductase small subunit NirD n=1 Tax=Guyparkeria TaxID=2035712 RepID=UPI0010AC366C|nr:MULTISPECIES: nitrite reductase small subunit NirD [Guyparkeria]MCL7750289.1 nitrite reductase small subunit NirD [Guyparkeria hydrothermalis]TKA88734.1 nitrite reductase small subunit NirD [Guyparkeria sp. SB14A]
MSQSNANDLTWYRIGPVSDIPPLGSRVVQHQGVRIAIFRAHGDAIFAVRDQCPHKEGPLSQGIVHGQRVTCPLHGWVIELASGEAVKPDVGCTPRYPTRVDDEGVISLGVPALPPELTPADDVVHDLADDA